LEPGAWSLELGAWSLEPGAWSLELGAWSLEPGSRCWMFDVPPRISLGPPLQPRLIIPPPPRSSVCSEYCAESRYPVTSRHTDSFGLHDANPAVTWLMGPHTERVVRRTGPHGASLASRVRILEWKLGEPQSMWTPSLSCIFWSTIVIQMISVVTIMAVQLFPHGRRRSLCQQVFFGLLIAMGLVTVLAVSSASDSWMTSGATLSVMTVCATFDLGANERGAASF
jgi:hypothetical protein